MKSYRSVVSVATIGLAGYIVRSDYFIVQIKLQNSSTLQTKMQIS